MAVILHLPQFIQELSPSPPRRIPEYARDSLRESNAIEVKVRVEGTDLPPGYFGPQEVRWEHLSSSLGVLTPLLLPHRRRLWPWAHLRPLLLFCLLPLP